jgi:hypothetical protein
MHLSNNLVYLEYLQSVISLAFFASRLELHITKRLLYSPLLRYMIMIELIKSLANMAVSYRSCWNVFFGNYSFWA